MTATLATPKRRRLRFSLRSMLLLIAFICVLLAWIGWKIDRARQQRLILRDISPFDGVMYDMPQWFPDAVKTPAVFHTNLFDVTELVFVGNPNTTNDKLVHLARLPKLRKLDLASRF